MSSLSLMIWSVLILNWKLLSTTQESADPKHIEITFPPPILSNAVADELRMHCRIQRPFKDTYRVSNENRSLRNLHLLQHILATVAFKER